MRICILDPWLPDDPALVNSHWVARQTADTLRREYPDVVLETVAGAGVSPTAVDSALAQAHDGFVYFGHGRTHDLWFRRDDAGQPIPLIGLEQIRSVGARWFHAFACWSGQILGLDAASAGVGAYLGYQVAVNLHWEVSDLPDPLHTLLTELVTAATLDLARGERSRDRIRTRVRTTSDRLLDWLDNNPDACASIPWIELTGLHVLATLLHRDLVLEGVDVLR